VRLKPMEHKFFKASVSSSTAGVIVPDGSATGLRWVDVAFAGGAPGGGANRLVPFSFSFSLSFPFRPKGNRKLSFVERFSGTSAVSLPAELLRLLARDIDIGGDEDLAGGEILLRDDIV